MYVEISHLMREIQLAFFSRHLVACGLLTFRNSEGSGKSPDTPPSGTTSTLHPAEIKPLEKFAILTPAAVPEGNVNSPTINTFFIRFWLALKIKLMGAWRLGMI